MPRIIEAPTRIQAHGTPPKTIEEFVGRANSRTEAVSIARMVSPAGWSEPGQTPEFDEFTVVLRGQLQVETRDGIRQIAAGQAMISAGASGFATALQRREGLSISQCVCQLFRQRRFTETRMMWPNEITGANAGGLPPLPLRTRWAARLAQFRRYACNTQQPFAQRGR
jgi:hypothetical protein